MTTELRDMGTREGFIAAIRDCGQYIIDHAEGLLGEYPGAALNEMSITAHLEFFEPPVITVKRDHIVEPCFEVTPCRNGGAYGNSDQP